MKFNIPYPSEGDKRKWFAWRPVEIETGTLDIRYVWLEWVWKEWNGFGYFYTEIEKKEKE
jgi:hypothetical protein